MEKIPHNIPHETVWRSSLKCIQAGMTGMTCFSFII
jgi:hypothetical protein